MIAYSSRTYETLASRFPRFYGLTAKGNWKIENLTEFTDCVGLGLSFTEKHKDLVVSSKVDFTLAAYSLKKH